jgi:hypothetical protein
LLGVYQREPVVLSLGELPTIHIVTTDHLVQREIEVRNLLAENEVVALGVAFQDSFNKIAEELRYSDRGEVCGALFGLVHLLLIVQDVRDRMVRLAGFIQPIGYRQLQLMRPELARFAFWNRFHGGRMEICCELLVVRGTGRRGWQHLSTQTILTG